MYATRHDPWVYFHSIIDSPTCKTELVVGLNVLTTDLASAAKTPNLSYITPNVCDDGHDAPCKDGRPGGLVSADTFLQKWVPKILASPAYKAGGMLVITFDEAELGNRRRLDRVLPHAAVAERAKPGLNGPGGGRVGALIISSNTKANDERHAVQPLRAAVQHGERVRPRRISASRARPASRASARTCTTDRKEGGRTPRGGPG